MNAKGLGGAGGSGGASGDWLGGGVYVGKGNVSLDGGADVSNNRAEGGDRTHCHWIP